MNQLVTPDNESEAIKRDIANYLNELHHDELNRRLAPTFHDSAHSVQSLSELLSAVLDLPAHAFRRTSNVVDQFGANDQYSMY